MGSEKIYIRAPDGTIQELGYGPLTQALPVSMVGVADGLTVMAGGFTPDGATLTSSPVYVGGRDRLGWSRGLLTDAVGVLQVGLPDSSSLDAFARLRVSNPFSLFESQHQYDASPLLWNTATSGAGSATHSANESAVNLSVGTASGDSVIRQTKKYFRYQSGKSQLTMCTFVLGALKTGVRKRVGYFDDSDGLFLEDDGTSVFLVQRSFASGVAVDSRVAQSSWNVDAFTGNGPSGISLDFTQAQLFFLDFSWLGAGRSRLGFVVNGVFWVAHEFLAGNVLSTVFMRTPNLPVRYSIENTATAASGTTLKQICSAVISEGGHDFRGLPFGANRGASGKAITAVRTPTLSIRLKTTFNSITNRGLVIPRTITLAALTADTILYEIMLSGSLTGAAFASVDTNSLCEYDIAATAITGGTLLDSGYFSTQSREAFIPVLDRAAMSLDLNGSVSDILTICAATAAGAGTALSSMAWEEYR